MTGPSYLTDLLDHATDRERYLSLGCEVTVKQHGKNRKTKILVLVRIRMAKAVRVFRPCLSILNILTFASHSRRNVVG